MAVLSENELQIITFVTDQVFDSIGFNEDASSYKLLKFVLQNEISLLDQLTQNNQLSLAVSDLFTACTYLYFQPDVQKPMLYSAIYGKAHLKVSSEVGFQNIPQYLRILRCVRTQFLFFAQ